MIGIPKSRKAAQRLFKFSMLGSSHTEVREMLRSLRVANFLRSAGLPVMELRPKFFNTLGTKHVINNLPVSINN
jgi:hypothetical protein